MRIFLTKLSANSDISAVKHLVLFLGDQVEYLTAETHIRDFLQSLDLTDKVIYRVRINVSAVDTSVGIIVRRLLKPRAYEIVERKISALLARNAVERGVRYLERYEGQHTEHERKEYQSDYSVLYYL